MIHLGYRSPNASHDPPDDCDTKPDREDGDGDDNEESLFDLSCDSVSQASISMTPQRTIANPSATTSSPYAVADLLGTSLRNLEIGGSGAQRGDQSQNFYHETEQAQPPTYRIIHESPQLQQPLPESSSVLADGSVAANSRVAPPYVNVPAENISSGNQMNSSAALPQSHTSTSGGSSSTASGERIAISEDGTPYLKSSLC